MPRRRIHKCMNEIRFGAVVIVVSLLVLIFWNTARYYALANYVDSITK